MRSHSRREFLRDSALAIGGAVSALALKPSVFGRTLAGLERPPFHMLALGDSVMWGQGLDKKDKFSYRLSGWLCEQRGGACQSSDDGGTCENNDGLRLHVEAHSGAIISEEGSQDDETEDKRFTRQTAPLKYCGEVNNGYPTIRAQVELARRYYLKNSIPLTDVGLVLVNGGINDLNAFNLLLFKILGGDVTKKAKDYCEVRMTSLLKSVALTFPNARIVVPGYFPLVSTETPRDILLVHLRDLLFDLNKEDQKGVSKEISGLPASPSGGSALSDLKAGFILTNLAKRSRDWVTASDNSLNQAVQNLNNASTPLPVSKQGSEAPPPEASMRALFAAVPFKDKNAYGTAEGDTFLWRLGQRKPDLVLECPGNKLSGKLLVNDSQQGGRPCMCDQAGKHDDLACVRAAAFHPNQLGADAYFKAIKGKLEPILGFTGWTSGT